MDKRLLGINNKYQIVLNDTARNSESYKKYHGMHIKLPTNPKYHPDKEALQHHCNLYNLV